MGTAVERASALEEIHMKAEGYGIPHSRLDDGMDIMKVREASEAALEQVRGGKGPYFLEIVTYRFQGHSMGDPQRYRQKEEVTKWEKDDPIGIYNRYLVKQELATKADLDKGEKAVEDEGKEAGDFAERSPDPGLDRS